MAGCFQNWARPAYPVKSLVMTVDAMIFLHRNDAHAETC
jgi:hypothetical protein